MNGTNQDENWDISDYPQLEDHNKILFIKKKLNLSWPKLAERIYYTLHNEADEHQSAEEEENAVQRYSDKLKKAIERKKKEQKQSRKRIYIIDDALKCLSKLKEVKALDLPESDEDWQARYNNDYINEICHLYNFHFATKKSNSVFPESLLKNLNRVISFANKGHCLAQKTMGDFYFYGGNLGIPNFIQAYDYYTRAANQKCGESLYQLGLMHEYDFSGFEENVYLAFKYYFLSAEQNYLMAINKVAFFYGKGYGVKQDNTLFFEYSEKSTKLDDEMGWCLLAYAYTIGKGTEVNLKKAADIYQKLFDKKGKYWLHACARLSYLHKKGAGVPINFNHSNYLKEIIKNHYGDNYLDQICNILKSYNDNNDDIDPLNYLIALNLEIRPVSLFYNLKSDLEHKLFGSTGNLFGMKKGMIEPSQSRQESKKWYLED